MQCAQNEKTRNWTSCEQKTNGQFEIQCEPLGRFSFVSLPRQQITTKHCKKASVGPKSLNKPVVLFKRKGFPGTTLQHNFPTHKHCCVNILVTWPIFHRIGWPWSFAWVPHQFDQLLLLSLGGGLEDPQRKKDLSSSSAASRIILTERKKQEHSIRRAAVVFAKFMHWEKSSVVSFR